MRKFMKTGFCLFLSVSLLCGCGKSEVKNDGSKSSESSTKENVQSGETKDDILSDLSSMDLEISQYPNWDEDMVKLLTKTKYAYYDHDTYELDYSGDIVGNMPDFEGNIDLFAHVTVDEKEKKVLIDGAYDCSNELFRPIDCYIEYGTDRLTKYSKSSMQASLTGMSSYWAKSELPYDGSSIVPNFGMDEQFWDYFTDKLPATKKYILSLTDGYGAYVYLQDDDLKQYIKTLDFPFDTGSLTFDDSDYDFSVTFEAHFNTDLILDKYSYHIKVNGTADNGKEHAVYYDMEVKVSGVGEASVVKPEGINEDSLANGHILAFYDAANDLYDDASYEDGIFDHNEDGYVQFQFENDDISGTAYCSLKDNKVKQDAFDKFLQENDGNTKTIETDYGTVYFANGSYCGILEYEDMYFVLDMDNMSNNRDDIYEDSIQMFAKWLANTEDHVVTEQKNGCGSVLDNVYIKINTDRINELIER